MKQPRPYFHTFSTRFGKAAVLFLDGAFPIKRIFLPDSDDILTHGKTSKKTLGVSHLPPAVAHLCKEIQAFFTGQSIETPWKILDLSHYTPLQQKVLKTVATVPFGTTRTYGQIATDINRPKASRFVGTVLRKNCFPVVIPCHRIIRWDGSPGAFAGGIEGTALKKRMLTLEKTGADPAPVPSGQKF